MPNDSFASSCVDIELALDPLPTPEFPPITRLRPREHRVATALRNAPTPGGVGLAVIAEAHRIVGTWPLRLNRVRPGKGPTQAEATLHACVGLGANASSTGAYLTVDRWPVAADDMLLAAELYEELAKATLRRLTWLMERSADSAAREHPQRYSLKLVDNLRSSARALSLLRLEAEVLELLASGLSVPGLLLDVGRSGYHAPSLWSDIDEASPGPTGR